MNSRVIEQGRTAPSRFSSSPPHALPFFLSSLFTPQSPSSFSLSASFDSFIRSRNMQATVAPDFDALKRSFEAGAASTNGAYPGGPFVPAPPPPQGQQQPLNGNAPTSTNGASTSPFLSGANSPNNGQPLSGFGSPSSVPGGLPLPAGNGMTHGEFACHLDPLKRGLVFSDPLWFFR